MNLTHWALRVCLQRHSLKIQDKVWLNRRAGTKENVIQVLTNIIKTVFMDQIRWIKCFLPASGTKVRSKVYQCLFELPCSSTNTLLYPCNPSQGIHNNIRTSQWLQFQPGKPMRYFQLLADVTMTVFKDHFVLLHFKPFLKVKKTKTYF